MNEFKPQQGDTGRLLSVANLEQADSGKKAIAWFFETPQVFEFMLDGEPGQTMFGLLKEAKEQQQPVNIFSVPDQNKNIITKVTAATEAQLNSYKEAKGKREQATPAPTPKNIL